MQQQQQYDMVLPRLPAGRAPARTFAPLAALTRARFQVYMAMPPSGQVSEPLYAMASQTTPHGVQYCVQRLVPGPPQQQFVYYMPHGQPQHPWYFADSFQ